MTKFEEDLKVYFPDIYQLHVISKSEKYLWDAIRALISMRNSDLYGKVIIRYHAGKIDKILKEEDLTAGMKESPNLNVPGQIEKP